MSSYPIVLKDEFSIAIFLFNGFTTVSVPFLHCRSRPSWYGILPPILTTRRALSD